MERWSGSRVMARDYKSEYITHHLNKKKIELVEMVLEQ